MNIPSECRPGSKRPVSAKSASTHLFFPASPRHSASRAKTSQTSKQGSFTDFDITKNRSWSTSREKSGHFLSKSGGKRVDAPVQLSSRLSTSLTDTRAFLSPPSSPGTAGVPGDNKGQQLPTKELWNLRGSQVERLHQEWAAIEQCRTMKRASEMVHHRLDPMYRISGSNMPLVARYHVNDTELQRLQEMSETSRILQLDLKRIKYPQGYHSPRRERTSITKPHGSKSGPGLSPQNSMSGEGEGEEVGQLHDVVTSPVSQPPAEAGPGVGDPQPTSPISTPEDTPRLNEEQGGASMAENPGEASHTEDDSQHFS